ncbi:hypothetical protein AAZX31_03G164500 [Glycine max]
MHIYLSMFSLVWTKIFGNLFCCCSLTAQFSFLCWMHLVICIMQTGQCFLGKKCAVVILCCPAFHKYVCSCFIFCPSCYVDKLVD